MLAKSLPKLCIVRKAVLQLLNGDCDKDGKITSLKHFDYPSLEIREAILGPMTVYFVPSGSSGFFCNRLLYSSGYIYIFSSGTGCYNPSCPFFRMESLAYSVHPCSFGVCLYLEKEYLLDMHLDNIIMEEIWITICIHCACSRNELH